MYRTKGERCARCVTDEINARLAAARSTNATWALAESKEERRVEDSVQMVGGLEIEVADVAEKKDMSVVCLQSKKVRGFHC